MNRRIAKKFVSLKCDFLGSDSIQRLLALLKQSLASGYKRQCAVIVRFFSKNVRSPSGNKRMYLNVFIHHVQNQPTSKGGHSIIIQELRIRFQGHVTFRYISVHKTEERYTLEGWRWKARHSISNAQFRPSVSPFTSVIRS